MNVMVFRALADPNRFGIVELLKEGSLPVGIIAERLELSQPQTSKHLRVLAEAGLVQVEPSANKRIYQLRTVPLQELETWLQTYRRMWEEKFDNLDDYLHQLQQVDNNKDHKE
ncbi:ArsR/SmtB family transcription factor [Paenibacillus albidus]|uniref:ArsR/SmtB family transcription factor n=1 Tax=Paenibacillus albidus TaxID=2041023 RepID=UPI001665956D|nr:metalloregulator ArsR/SmtB family transcription factor [Paenibacillus albidus]